MVLVGGDDAVRLRAHAVLVVRVIVEQDSARRFHGAHALALADA